MKTSAYTLLELILVVAIVGLLLTLCIPEFGKFIHRSKSVACMNNLRQIGVAVTNYLGDHDGWFPRVEPDPDSPIYDEEAGIDILGLLDTFEPYGMTKAVAVCRTGTPYEWRPFLDDEKYTDPKMYTRRRGVRPIRPSRTRLVIDQYSVHFGRKNALYADGRVKGTLQ